MKNPTEKQKAWWEYHVAVCDLGPDHELTLSLWERVQKLDAEATRPLRRLLKLVA